MNTANAYNNEIPATIPCLPPDRVVERRIGRTTFIVSSRFNDGKEKDIVSIIARLVKHGMDSYGESA